MHTSIESIRTILGTFVLGLDPNIYVYNTAPSQEKKLPSLYKHLSIVALRGSFSRLYGSTIGRAAIRSGASASSCREERDLILRF